MSKALRTVAVIAGSVALIATGVGAAVGAAGIAGVASAATIATVATVASVTAGVASLGAQLTAPKATARGSPAQVTIDIEPPRPYAVGEVMVGGVIRYDRAYGATLKKVPNPYRWQVRVLSGVGPIDAIVGDYFDFAPISAFYDASFFRISNQLGLRPQATALAPQITGAGGAPGWTAASKLSGCAAVGLNMKFDKDGKRFASGVPIYTALVRGEKVYDPRLDSTFPGGSGSCRAGNESTYVYSRNPACHALTYALGRFQNGLRIFGLGQPIDTIDLPAIVDWANDCDANGWTVNILLKEGGTGANLREQRVSNLDDLCAAGGGRWYQAGGLLSFDWHRPRISLATLTDEDILEAGGGTDAVPTVRDRMNGVRPQYVSPLHNWQQITAAEIVGTTYRDEDGDNLTQVYPLNGVTNAEQAGELAAYAMADSREIGPMDLQAKAAWRFYRPGDCITIDSSLVAYAGQAVINQRGLNPDTLAVSLSLKSETPGKHDFALGKTATPPPTPELAQTPEERDLLASAALTPRAVDVEFDDGRTVEELQPIDGGATRNVPRGTYGAGETYIAGDTVLFSGSTYQLIVAESTGNAPPDALRWALIANAGTGTPGADGLPGLTITVSNEAHVVATAQDGSGGSYTAAGGTMRLLRGTTELTPTFSIAAATPATSWISINSTTGVYTVTDPGVNLATATLRANWAGVNYDRTYTLAKSLAGVDGTNGVDGLVGFLTNEAHTVAVDAAGAFTLTGSEGAFRVFSGATDVTASATFSIVGGTVSGAYQIRTLNGLRLWIDTGGTDAGTFFLTIPGAGWTSTSETFTLRATYGGVTIDRVYSISKAVAGANGAPGTNGTNGAPGANGANAKTITVISDRQTIAYDAAGAPSPSTQTTTFTTNKQNTTNTVTWSITDAAGVARTPVTTFLSSATGDSVTMTEAQFASARNGTSGVIVTASITDGTTFNDRISVVRVQAGAAGTNGAPGANAKTLTVLSDRQTIAYNAAGAPTPTTQTTTFSTNKQNTTGTVNWTITDAAGVNRTPVTSFLSSATGDSVTMTEAQFASARNGTSGVIVTGSITDGTTFSDKISVVRVQEGQTGATGPEGDTTGVITLYRRAAETPVPAKPTSASIVYTIASNTATNTDFWSTVPPAVNGAPLWAIYLPFATTNATVTVAGASFSTPVIINRDGVSATTGLLTNEAHTVAAASDGTGYSLTGAGGNFEVFFGGANVRLTSTFSIVGGTDGGANWTKTQNGLTMTISELSGVYTLSGASWTTDTETFTLRSVYQGVTLDQTYTISKSRAGASGAAGANGADGANAKVISLSATRQQIRFNSAGSLDPSSQDTVFTVARQNTTNAATFTIFDLAGTAVSSALLTGTGDSRTLTAANFNTARGSTQGVRVVATVTDGGALTDQITVIRVQDGVDANQVRIATNFETFPFIAHTGQPVVQTATLVANLTAISGTVTWRLKAEGSETLITPTTAWMTVSVNTATITQAQFAQFLIDYPGTTMRVVATLAGFSDERVLTRVADATTNPAGGSFIRTRNGDVSIGGWIGAATSTTVPAGTTRPGARSLQLATNSRERPPIARVIRPGDSFRLRYTIRTIGSGTACGNIFFALYNDAGTAITTSTSFANLPIHSPNVLDWTYVDQVITYTGTTEIINWCPGVDSINATVGNVLFDNLDMDFAAVNPVAAGNSNRVQFSRMEGDRGWKISFNPAALATTTAYGALTGRRFYSVDFTTTGSGQECVIAQAADPGAAFPVTPGERVSVQARVTASGPVGSWTMGLRWVRSNGTQTRVVVASGSGTVDGGAINQSAFLTAPTDAPAVVGAFLDVQGFSSGSGTMKLLIAEPMVTSAAVGQTVHPPFTPGLNSDDGADVTATAQRSIEPQFPVIEIKQGEAGHTGNRTVTHVAKRGTSTITGGTWSLPIVNLGAGSATINSTTGTVTLSGIVQSGAYAVRYTHTDGLATDQAVNVTYVPTPTGGVVSAKTGTTTSTSGVGNTSAWSQVIALTLTGAPTGRLFFNFLDFTGGNRIRVSSGTGTCQHQARLLINGTVVATAFAELTVSSGIAQLVDFGALFEGTHSVTSGTVTVSVELQRTSGTGTITLMSNSLDATIIAT